MRVGWIATVALIGACRTPIADLDGSFYGWDDRAVHCSVEVDDVAGHSLDEIFAGYDRVRDTGEVLEILVHRPGESLSSETFEALLAGVRDRGLEFLTATDMVRGTPRAGVAIMYDGEWLPSWIASLDVLARYNAKVTVYVARYKAMTELERTQLGLIAAAGHDLEAHSVNHLRAPSYVEQRGLRAYLDDEVLPSIDALRADGYDVVSFAYPFGRRTEEIDQAILATGSVTALRAVSLPNELRANPCPY